MQPSTRFLSGTLALALTAALAACGGGGGGGSVPTGPGGGGTGAVPTTLSLPYGGVSGVDNTFSPNDGDSASGGNGATIDGVPCLPSMDETHYHVHAFIGFIVNGQLRALPDGTGMKDPGADTSGVVSGASCYYYLHTHDATGVVHIESPSTAARTTTLYTLGTYLDIWGQSLSGSTIYTSGAIYQGEGEQTVSNSTYAQYTGDPRSIPLYAHEVIWVIQGSPAYSASQLPNVHFTY